MKFCFRSLRESDCFCSRYDENRQTMFYCGFFTTLAGFIWFIIGFGLRCAFFAETLGPSVNAVACGIMVVGIMVLVAGLCCTFSVVCAGKSHNKTTCISSSTSLSSNSGKLRSKQLNQKIFFDSPMDDSRKCRTGGSGKCTCAFRNDSFSSAELNPSITSSSMASSTSRPTSSTTTPHTNSYKSDIAFIA